MRRRGASASLGSKIAATLVRDLRAAGVDAHREGGLVYVPGRGMLTPALAADLLTALAETRRSLAAALEHPPCIVCGAPEPDHDDGCMLAPASSSSSS